MKSMGTMEPSRKLSSYVGLYTGFETKDLTGAAAIILIETEI